MRPFHLHAILLTLIWLFLTPFASLAQESGSGPGITIVGQISNGTPGATVPADLPLMLHTYDGQSMTGMTDGVADAEGRFRFEDIATAPGRSFEVMVTYGDVSYFSERIEPRSGQTQLDLPVTIYETTTDTTAVQVEQLHLLLDFTPGVMQIMQIYILSNAGDRTVLARGEEGLRFRLPAAAIEVNFERDGEETRWIRTEDGFIDTAPVAPGQGTLATSVRYALPYTGYIKLEVPVDYPTARASVLLPEVGVTLSGPGWLAGRELLLQGRVHQAYSYGDLPLLPGDTLRLTVEGQPEMSSPAPSSPARAAIWENRRLVIILGMVVSLALIAFGGIWWWRDRQRTLTLPSHAPASDQLASLLQAMADLDDAYQAGVIDEAEYQEQRTRLRSQAVALLADRGHPE